MSDENNDTPMSALSGDDSSPAMGAGALGNTEAPPTPSAPLSGTDDLEAQASNPATLQANVAATQAAQATPDAPLWQKVLVGALTGLAGSAGAKSFGGGLAGGAGAVLQKQQQDKDNAIRQRQQDNADQNADDVHQSHLANGLLVNMQIAHQWDLMHPDHQKQALDAMSAYNASLQANGVKPSFTGSEADATTQAQKLITSADPNQRWNYRVLPSISQTGQFDVVQVPADNTLKPVDVQMMGADGKMATHTLPAGTPWAQVDAINSQNQKNNMEIGAKKLEAQNAANVKAQQDKQQNDDSLVAGMLDGSLDITKISNLRDGERQRLVALAKQKDPSFNMENYAQRLQTSKYFSPGGKGNDQIVSLNTFAGHVGEANDGIENLRNTNNQYVNSTWNKVAEKFGSTNIAPQRAALQAVKDEYLNFLKAGHAPSVDEQKLADSLLSTDQTPAQTQEVLRKMAQVVKVRSDAMAFGYQRTMGKPMESPYSPDTVNTLSKFGIKVGQPQAQTQAPAASNPNAVQDLIKKHGG